MRRMLVSSCCAWGVSLALSAAAVNAQDPVKVAPDTYKVTIDNASVRVLDIHVKAGEKVPMHSHPGYVVVALSDCKTKFTFADGKSQEIEVKEGTAIWRDAESHAVENLGSAECHVLNIEVKKAKAAAKHK
jgi:beta-alanine degradation protein BauB